MSKDVETSGKYVLPSKLNYEDYLTAIGQRAQDSYEQAVKDAETARQKEVLAAGNAYSSALANSGANAAALSSMGLAQSGYSRYLDSQAYAQKQNAVNNAYKNKQSAVNLAKTSLDSALSDVEGSYAKYLVQQETDRKNAYQGIYDKLPTLSLGDIDRLGATMGLKQPDIDALKIAKNEQSYASLSGQIYSPDDIKKLEELGYVDSKYGAKLYQDSIKYLTDNASSISFDDGNGGLMEYASAKYVVDTIKSLQDIPEATKTAIDKRFKTLYVAQTNGVTLKKDGGTNKTAGDDGNKIKVQDANGKVYKVRYSGDKLESTNKVADNVKTNEVFLYNGVVYIKTSGGIYALEARKNDKDYNALVTRLGG